MKVFRPFLFFFLGAFVVAHRIDWHGREETRAATGLDAPTENVTNLLRGAIKERGAAIMFLWHHGVAAPTSIGKFVGARRSQDLLATHVPLWGCTCNIYRYKSFAHEKSLAAFSLPAFNKPHNFSFR